MLEYEMEQCFQKYCLRGQPIQEQQRPQRGIYEYCPQVLDLEIRLLRVYLKHYIV